MVAVGQNLVVVPVAMADDGLGNLPAFVRRLHHGAAAASLFIEIAPCRFFLTRFGRVGLKPTNNPARSGQLFAAKLDSAVVIAQFDIDLQRRYCQRIRLCKSGTYSP